MWRDIAVRSVWLSAGSAVGRLLPFLVLVMLGHRLPTAEFASIGVGFAWTAVAASLTTAGLANVTTQRLALLGPHSQRAFIRHTVRLGCLFSGALLVVAAVAGPEGARLAFGHALDPSVVWPALVCGSVWSLVMLIVAIFNGQHRPRSAASVLGLGGALQGTGLIVGHTLGNTAQMVMWGAALGNVLALAWAIARVRTKHPDAGLALGDIEPKVHDHIGRSIAWSSLAAASVMPVTFVAGSLVSHTTDGTRQLAAFQALEQLHQLAIYLPGVLGQALLPVLAVHFDRRSGEAVRKVVRASMVLAVVGSVLAAALAWEPGWLLRSVGNPALTDPAATRAMLLNAGLAVSLSLLGGGLLACGHYARATLMNLGWAALFLGMAWHWRGDGVVGIETARLYASWALLVAASAALWFGASVRPVATASASNSFSCPP